MTDTNKLESTQIEDLLLLIQDSGLNMWTTPSEEHDGYLTHYMGRTGHWGREDRPVVIGTHEKHVLSCELFRTMIWCAWDAANDVTLADLVKRYEAPKQRKWYVWSEKSEPTNTSLFKSMIKRGPEDWRILQRFGMSHADLELSYLWVELISRRDRRRYPRWS